MLVQQCLAHSLCPIVYKAAAKIKIRARHLPGRFLGPSIEVEVLLSLVLVVTFDPVVADGVLQTDAHQGPSPECLDFAASTANVPNLLAEPSAALLLEMPNFTGCQRN